MKVLITGLGITGKSSFRKKLYQWLSEIGLTVEQYDCDYDRHLLPSAFRPSVVYLIEDVHGPTAGAVFPLSSFNLIFYLWPCPTVQLRFLLRRAWQWFKTGRLAWDADKGKWAETGRAYDLTNLIPIARELWRMWRNRRSWLENDLEIIKKSGIKTIIIIPRIKKERIYFS